MTINEASEYAGKSIQTIRRMIKQKKIQVKRHKTPQGFNYLIDKESLEGFLKESSIPTTQNVPTSQPATREHRSIAPSFEDKFNNEVERFNSTVQKLVEQNQRDKENFFGLIKTFQERIFGLENQIKMLESPKKSWWQLW